MVFKNYADVYHRYCYTIWMRIRLGGGPGVVTVCGGIKRLLGKGTHPPRRPPRGIDIYIKGERRTGHRNRYVTPGGETCTAESSKLKGDHWGTPPVDLSHSIEIDAYVDSFVDGLQIADRNFHSRRGRWWYGGRPWNGIGWPPVRRRVRGRGVVDGGGRVTKPRGKTRHRANLGGLGLGCRLTANGIWTTLDGKQLSSLRLRGGPGGRRGTSGRIGTRLIERCVQLSGRQGPGLPLW